MAAPLEGIRILDFTRVLAGPYLTMVLADLGAEVIKVEHPKGGDDTRFYQPPGQGGESGYFLSINRHKKSVTINLASEEGKQIVRELVAKSDVLVQNFRADVMQRQGLGWEDLRKVNPKLIYASISGYGADSPYRLVAGYDQIAQGEGGLQYLTGAPENDPVRAGASVADTFTGLHTGMAILAALRSRDATGEGQHIDLALLDTVMAITCFHAQNALLTGENPPRTGNDSYLVIPTGLYWCSDGAINMMTGNERQYRKLCTDVLERPDLTEDPRFATNAARRENNKALDAILREIFATQPRDHWVERARVAGVPCGSVRSPTEALVSPEAAARGLVQDVQHPKAGAYRTVGSPIKMSGTPVRQAGPAPVLGQHTAEVLREVLGYDKQRIDMLVKAGTVTRDDS